MLHAIPAGHDGPAAGHGASPLASLTASLRDGRVHLLVAASGSVATIKLPLLLGALGRRHANLSIRVLLTPAAARFLAGQAAEQPPVSSLSGLPNVDGVYLDEDEWHEPWKRGNAILHIELRRWADLMVIAPLSANTMAKIVNGMADGLLTSVVRAWDAHGELDSDVLRDTTVGLASAAAEPAPGDGSAEGVVAAPRRRSQGPKRIIVAPAMNTAMWRHPITAKQIRVLEEEYGIGPAGDGDGWFEVLRPQQKTLACGDVGDGAMMEWSEIVKVVEERLGLRV